MRLICKLIELPYLTIANDDLGILELLPQEVYPSSPDIARTPFIRAVQFIDSDTVVVTYLGAVGVK